MSDHHYFRTSDKCKTREDCWQELHDYLVKHTANQLVFFRDIPQVYSDRDFDTKKMKHRGFVRFTVFNARNIEVTANPAGVA